MNGGISIPTSLHSAWGVLLLCVPGTLFRGLWSNLNCAEYGSLSCREIASLDKRYPAALSRAIGSGLGKGQVGGSHCDKLAGYGLPETHSGGSGYPLAGERQYAAPPPDDCPLYLHHAKISFPGFSAEVLPVDWPPVP